MKVWSGKHLKVSLERSPYIYTYQETITDQRLWMDIPEHRVKRQIQALCCEEWAFCEGIKVTRTNRRNELKYTIGRDKKQYRLEEAIAKVCQMAKERQNSQIIHE